MPPPTAYNDFYSPFTAGSSSLLFPCVSLPLLALGESVSWVSSGRNSKFLRARGPRRCTDGGVGWRTGGKGRLVRSQHSALGRLSDKHRTQHSQPGAVSIASLPALRLLLLLLSKAVSSHRRCSARIQIGSHKQDNSE